MQTPRKTIRAWRARPQDRKEEELKQRLAARKAVADYMMAILGDQTVVPPPKLERELEVVMNEISQIQEQLFYHGQTLPEDDSFYSVQHFDSK